jgi:undecaprenyl phosphate-alpha-L-ara4N flippase subunit ArnE
MLKLSLFVILQSILLVVAQTLLKISVQSFGKFSFTWLWFKNALTTWQFGLSGLCALAALITWMYVLKHYEMSIAYPLLAVSYIIGVLAGHFVFHEPVPLSRWIGVIIISIGAFIVAR